ncbi:MAG TPA: single-stranded DNA-binding protein [Nevskiaceae bacterium]|nr:single-stranded DNA-binding protein [Nevskiaceae bacterium]
MATLNRVEVIGHLGADADVRFTGAGTAITTLSIATTDRYKDKTGNQQERTEWFRVKLFGRLAESIGPIAKKGRQVYVDGRLHTDKYTDKDGQERTSVEVIGNRAFLLGSAPHASDAQGSGDDRPAQGDADDGRDGERENIPF